MSHDNITWLARVTCKYLDANETDRMVSYLPLSHSAPQIVDMWLSMASGACVSFADKDALKGTLVQTLHEVRPTFLLAVPRVFEKIMEKMQELGKNAFIMKRLIG